MPERIVVSFRGDADKEEYLGRALALKQRAEALGATLCAWNGRTFSFELAPDELEEAVSLATMAAEDQDIAPGERFAMGIAQGGMNAAGDVGRLASLSWGRPLLAAGALASIAAAGEVLLDPDLPSVQSGELLTTGSLRGVDGGRRVRGLLLDVRQPFRKLSAETVSRLRPPPLVGRVAELEQLVVPPGCLGVIRADPGAGGTRLLLELIHRLSPSRALLVTPVGASREPLGAVRRALSRASALGVEPGFPAAAAAGGAPAQQGSPVLTERLREALARLLVGDGADPWSVAELIDAWLAPARGRLGLLVIDDAGEIDQASLDAIAMAMSVRGSLRAFIRLGQAELFPAALASATVAATVTLGPLQPEDAEELVRRFFGGCISDTGARRWARRAEGSPLAVREALCEGLESGALRWLDRAAEPRRRSSARKPGPPPGKPGEGPVLRWIERRIAHLAPRERAVLTALAMLGGDASDAMINEVAEGMAGPGVKVAAAERALTGGAWVLRPEPGWIKLSSRTLRDALLASVPADARVPWHVAVAGTLRQQGGVLALADAAWHALQAEDRRAAADLAATAARAAGRAMLEAAEAELLVFAADQGADRDTPIEASEDGGGVPPTYRMPIEALGELLDVPPSAEGARPRFDTLLEEQRLISSPLPPPPSPARPTAPPETQPMPPTEPAVTTTRQENAPYQDAGPGSAVDPFPSRADQDPLAKTSESPVMVVADLAGRLADLAKHALLKGDVGMLERLVSELRLTGEHADLVERMAGFISLGRGAKSDALRRLRAAAEAEQRPARRARALLAYSVALAAAGRTESALLEVLSALARAREAEDRHGEQACARFLARLSLATGHEAAATAWSEIARLADPARAEVGDAADEA